MIPEILKKVKEIRAFFRFCAARLIPFDFGSAGR